MIALPYRRNTLVAFAVTPLAVHSAELKDLPFVRHAHQTQVFFNKGLREALFDGWGYHGGQTIKFES